MQTSYSQSPTAATTSHQRSNSGNTGDSTVRVRPVLHPVQAPSSCLLFTGTALLLLLNMAILFFDTSIIPAHTLTFTLTVLTDFALIPALFVMARYRRHFEMFVGILQIISALCYNICNALGTSIFLRETEWHKMNNVLAFTYLALLCIHLMSSGNETQNIILRYVAFSTITIGQIKDGFWVQEETPLEMVGMGIWTFIPVAFFGALPLFKFARERRLPAYDLRRLNKGIVVGALAIACFKVGLHKKNDPLRFWHGTFHVLIGLSLWYLWGVVPDLESKHKKDTPRKGAAGSRQDTFSTWT